MLEINTTSEQKKIEKPESWEKDKYEKEVNVWDQEINQVKELQEESEIQDLSWFRNEINNGISEQQEVANRAHDETKEDTIHKYGEYMSDEQIEKLRSDETKDKLEVVSYEDYFDRYPEQDTNVLGHCESDGRIIIIEGNEEVVRHVATHETTHLCADRGDELRDNGDKVNRSGIREYICTPEGSRIDKNRGINEGITQMYTVNELVDRGDEEAAYCIECYPDARFWAERLESMVGKENVAEAYYGQEKDKLIGEFTRLNNDNPAAWENFSRDIDILTYSGNETQRELAKVRLNHQFAWMARNKHYMDN